PLQQPVAGQTVQLGQSRGLDAADQANRQVADVGLATYYAVHRMRSAIISLEPESTISAGGTRGAAVFFHAPDPARKFVALDEQTVIAPRKDFAELLRCGIKSDIAHRWVGLFDRLVTFLLRLLIGLERVQVIAPQIVPMPLQQPRSVVDDWCFLARGI